MELISYNPTNFIQLIKLFRITSREESNSHSVSFYRLVYGLDYKNGYNVYI